MNYTFKEIKTDEDFKELEREWEAQQQATHEMIRHELKTQNGRMTEAPMYCVMEIVKLSDMYPASTSETTVEMKREVFFTNKEAKQYIAERKHKHKGELFIYVDSGHRNDGWKYARELILNSGNKS